MKRRREIPRIDLLLSRGAPPPLADASHARACALACWHGRGRLRIIILALVINPGFLNELRRIVGTEGVLHDPLDVLTYECDGLPHLRTSPAAVGLPSSAAEVRPG